MKMTWLTGDIASVIAQIQAEQIDQDNQVEVDQAVATIIQTVRQQKDQALLAYTKEFDGVALTELTVSDAVVAEAFERIEPEVHAALIAAKENIVSYHTHQIEQGFIDFPDQGVIRGQKIVPLNRIAVYVPGGTAAYPSSVLMNVLPAKLAGVKEVVMFTPPPKEGLFNAAILVAAKLAGVDTIYQVGGAQAIAAAAYGTETIRPVDKIVGPGNRFVAAAKKQVFGKVGIDMIAGPSEIGILARADANPAYLAADLLSQAEHDVFARTFLVTDSKDLAEAVEKEVFKQVESLPRKEIAQQAILRYGRIVIAQTVDEMFTLMNALAPEHLEIAFPDALSYLDRVENAGSVFLGPYTSEPIGDYYAGSNHVLPTSGTARFASALGVHDFVKRIQYVSYTHEAVTKAAPAIQALANKEGLFGHARAVAMREENQ